MTKTYDGYLIIRVDQMTGVISYRSAATNLDDAIKIAESYQEEEDNVDVYYFMVEVKALPNSPDKVDKLIEEAKQATGKWEGPHNDTTPLIPPDLRD